MLAKSVFFVLYFAKKARYSSNPDPCTYILQFQNKSDSIYLDFYYISEILKIGFLNDALHIPKYQMKWKPFSCRVKVWFLMLSKDFAHWVLHSTFINQKNKKSNDMILFITQMFKLILSTLWFSRLVLCYLKEFKSLIYKITFHSDNTHRRITAFIGVLGNSLTC